MALTKNREFSTDTPSSVKVCHRNAGGVSALTCFSRDNASQAGAYQVADQIRNATALDTRVTVLGHVQRGGSPTSRDRMVATYMGYEAVKLLAEGKTCRVVAMRGDDIVDYDITEALSMTKGLDELSETVARAMTGVSDDRMI